MANSNEIIFISISGIATASTIFYYIKNNKQQKINAELNKKITKLKSDFELLEIENATTKLNPHLLKNTLNTIHYFSWQTTNAIEKLSDMLKFILGDSNRKYVSLNEEIEFLNVFCDVHKLKLSPQTKFNIDIDFNEADSKLKIAPLLTINFIENAFVHGDFTLPNSFLELKVFVKNNELVYEVKNSYTKQDKEPGFGIENFRKRLNLLHRDKYEIQLNPSENVYSATLKLKMNEN